MDLSKFEKGICFEETDILIPWKIPLSSLGNYGQPEISKDGIQTFVVWKEKTLLRELSGAWYVSYYPNQSEDSFNSIWLSYMGDIKSFEAYDRHKEFLLKELGLPFEQKETDSERKIKWVNGNVYIRLYLFEMHAFRYDLIIGVL